MILLLALSALAGLKIDTHTCTRLQCSDAQGQVQRLLRPFHVNCSARDHQGRITIDGLPGSFLFDVLGRHLGSTWISTCTVHTTPCQCKVKTFVVPQSGVGNWSDALRHSPFGRECAVSSSPYLGASVGCQHPDIQPPNVGWTPATTNQLSLETWGKAVTKSCLRASSIIGTASAGHKSSQWNTYIVPLFV